MKTNTQGYLLISTDVALYTHEHAYVHKKKLAVVAHVYNPSTLGVDTERLGVEGLRTV